MKDKLKIVKIGGNIIDNKDSLASVLVDFATLKGNKILVHGGGKFATNLSRKLDIPTQMVDGRRITSSENLEVVIMVYAGLISKKICAGLQANKCNAIGLSGADGNCIQAVLREKTPINYGWVGDISKVNTDTIQLFLDNNITPVFSAISHDGNGQLLNTNADTVAAEIAIAMSNKFNTELIYCFEKNGVLKDRNDPSSVIKSMNPSYYQELKTAGIIAEGMIPKIDNCFYALENNVSKVSIGGVSILANATQPFTTLIK